jgi:hypothetical protein
VYRGGRVQPRKLSGQQPCRNREAERGGWPQWQMADGKSRQRVSVRGGGQRLGGSEPSHRHNHGKMGLILRSEPSQMPSQTVTRAVTNGNGGEAEGLWRREGARFEPEPRTLKLEGWNPGAEGRRQNQPAARRTGGPGGVYRVPERNPESFRGNKH